MSRVNLLPTEVAAVVGTIDPDAYAANTYLSGYIALKNFRRFMAVVQAGDLGASATLDAKLVGYTNGSGGGAADITGAAITQLTQAGSDSNKQAIINLNTDSLAGLGFTHFAVSMTVGTATSDAAALVLGFDAPYAPASDSDAASVDEIKSV
ncbi:MAG: hypothetical protein ACOYBW_08625 [Fluviibacter phosphoraccumulans]